MSARVSGCSSLSRLIKVAFVGTTFGDFGLIEPDAGGRALAFFTNQQMA
jgi:hypothetical protein